MRNGQNKRMRGRNRNHKSHHSGGGGGGGGGGGHHHNPLTRVYESNGPEVKIRGTAHHIAEKYLQLARDAQGSGDPVTAENHFQHAEHYLRLIAAAQEQFRAQNPYYQAPPAPGEIRDEAFEGDEDEAASPAGSADAGPAASRASRISATSRRFQHSAELPTTSNRLIRRASSRSLTAASSRIRIIRAARSSSRTASRSLISRSRSNSSSRAGGRRPDAGQLPSFITGAQPQQSAQNSAPNGYDNQGGDRFPRHRRRRHRGPGGPRPRPADVPQDFRATTVPSPATAERSD